MIIPSQEKLLLKRERERAYRQNPARLAKEKEYQQKHKLTLTHRATVLKNKARIRAQKFNLDFSIDFDFVHTKLQNGICEATGVQLDMSTGPRKIYTPSLDRIDPKLGYTKENTQLVCTAYNLMKSNFDQKDVMLFMKQLGEIKWQ